MCDTERMVAMNLNEIKRAESGGHWRSQTLMWWRMYLRNLKMVRKLRQENRYLRSLLSDYANDRDA